MAEQVIAIDGPAASGKSTVAARVARHFRLPYVNTGNLFRAVTLAAMRRHEGVAPAELDAAQWRELLAGTELDYRPGTDGGFELWLNGIDPGAALRAPEVAAQVSVSAAVPAVREFVLATERRLAQAGWVVMEGRDIGTVVFPAARFKFFVTASPLERARRRLAQSGEVADGATLESVAAEIAERDRLDSTRAIAPLRAAEDAVLVDTTGMTIEQVVDLIVRQVGHELA